MFIRGRGRDPRIPSCVTHTWSVAGTIQAKFPPASVRRLGYDVVGSLTRFYEGGPALHACLRPTGIRSTRLSQGETPVPTKNKRAVMGPGPSLDEPCRTHRKVRPASGLGLPAGSACEPSVPECPLTLVIRGRDRGPRIPSCVANTRTGVWRPSRSALAKQNILCCGENVPRTPAFWFCHVSRWQLRAYPRT